VFNTKKEREKAKLFPAFSFFAFFKDFKKVGGEPKARPTFAAKNKKQKGMEG